MYGPMSFWYIIGTALGLAMDAFAVSVAAGVQLTTLRLGQVARLALAFGLFQFLMAVLGWLAGRGLSRWLEAVDHWVAFGLLVFIGGKMIWESFGRGDEARKDPTRGWTLLILAIATSIDALAVGLSFAFLDVSIWMPSIVIGLVALVLSAVGAAFGSHLGRRFGVWAERAGGLVLIGIGIKIVVDHIG